MIFRTVPSRRSCRAELNRAAGEAGGAGVSLVPLDADSKTRRRFAAAFNIGLGEIDPLRAGSADAVRRQEWILFLSPLLVVGGVAGLWLTPAGPVSPAIGIATAIVVFWTLISLSRRSSRFGRRCGRWRWFHARRGCPGCRAALDPARGRAIGTDTIWMWIGPDACPSCGKAWPLLP